MKLRKTWLTNRASMLNVRRRMFDVLSRLSVLTCLSALILTAPARDITYSNPVLPGDFPDPSVVRVGNDYWAVATSSEWGPIYPILHSRDLVNWEVKGHVFPEKPAWSTRNYWAPEIAHYQGKFHVYYTARKKDGPLCIALATATNALGPYTDHGPLVGQEEGSIDAVTAIDENGERYLIWKSDGNSRNLPTIFYTQKLSEDGTRLMGEMKELMRNDAPWEGNIIEGPFFLKHGDWFYLFYAGGNGCCGKACQYGTGVARAKKLLGPYEKNPANPILTNADQWRCTGHGSIVTDPQGRHFFMYHAYDNQNSVYVGRQGMLDEITWNADGWPAINNAGPSSVAVSPHGKRQRFSHAFSDNFSAKQLGALWQWPHAFKPGVKLERGAVTITSPAERGADLLGAVLARQTTTNHYTVTTVLDLEKLSPAAKAGLSAYGDAANAIVLAVNSGKAELVRRVKGRNETVATLEFPHSNKLHLRMTAAQGHQFRFAVSANGKNWREVGDQPVDGDYLPPWDRGIRVALIAGGTGNATASFNSFKVEPGDATGTRGR